MKLHMLESDEILLLGYKKTLCGYAIEGFSQEIEFVDCKHCLEEHKRREEEKESQLSLFS